MSVLSVPGVAGTKPIWGEVVWGEGFRDGGTIADRMGSTTGGGAGAAAALAESFSRARRARSRARRVASRRYWSLVKEVGLQDAEYPRGYFCGCGICRRSGIATFGFRRCRGGGGSARSGSGRRRKRGLRGRRGGGAGSTRR